MIDNPFSSNDVKETILEIDEGGKVTEVTKEPTPHDLAKDDVLKLTSELEAIANGRLESEIGLGGKDQAYWDKRDELNRAHSRMESLRGV